jgi:sigma-B regulation protein RsbQ
MRFTMFPLLLVAAGLVAGAARAEDPKPRSRDAKLGDVRVHYDDAGPEQAKEAVVFVHGWAGDRTVWRLQMPVFAKEARCLAIDLPGHGESDKPEVAYSMSYFAKAIDAVMRDAGVESAVLVGHSNGTPVVRQFWREYPKKTRALVIVDGALRSFFSDPKQVDQFVGMFKAPDYKDFVAKFVDSMFTSRMPDDAKADVKNRMLSTPQHVMVSSFEAVVDPAIWKEDTIDVPVLAIMAKSPFWTPEYEAFAKKICPKMEWHVLENVGHFVMMEKPDEFDALLAAFLAKQGLTKAR